jgi:drug/metabolite transporter (DMT)-like permease
MFSRKFNVQQLVYVELLTNFVLSIPLIFIFDDMYFHLNWKLILSLIYLATVATGLVFFLQMKFQKDSSATKAAIIYTLEPIFASSIAYFAVGESLNTVGIIGAGIIIAGILLSELGRF